MRRDDDVGQTFNGQWVKGKSPENEDRPVFKNRPLAFPKLSTKSFSVQKLLVHRGIVVPLDVSYYKMIPL
jgi:hypothetical protein